MRHSSGRSAPSSCTRWSQLAAAIAPRSGLAVFSHWLLDLVVHRPDLPLYDDAGKVELGLWNLPAIAFGLEALLLLGGIGLCVQQGLLKTRGALVFGVAMLAIHAQVFFGAPPASASAAAVTALAAYFAFAAIIHFVERPVAPRQGVASGP